MLFWQGAGPVGAIIQEEMQTQMFTGHWASHVLILLPWLKQLYWYEATWDYEDKTRRGVIRTPLLEYCLADKVAKHGIQGMAVKRLIIPLSLDQKAAILRKAEQLIGRKYNIWGLIGAAIKIMLGKLGINLRTNPLSKKGQNFCSQYLQKVMLAGGVDLSGIKPKNTWPSHLWKSTDLERVI